MEDEAGISRGRACRGGAPPSVRAGVCGSGVTRCGWAGLQRLPGLAWPGGDRIGSDRGRAHLAAAVAAVTGEWPGREASALPPGRAPPRGSFTHFGGAQVLGAAAASGEPGGAGCCPPPLLCPPWRRSPSPLAPGLTAGGRPAAAFLCLSLARPKSPCRCR